VNKQSFDVPVPVASAGKAFFSIAPGHEKFAFLYAVIAVGALGTAVTYGMVAGLSWLRMLLAFLGCLSVGWALLFSVLEARRLAQTPDERASEALEGRANPYTSRSVDIRQPTGDPYPHHEDYFESSGQDQGQRTSRLPGSTPLIDGFLERRREKDQQTRA